MRSSPGDSSALHLEAAMRNLEVGTARLIVCWMGMAYWASPWVCTLRGQPQKNISSFGDGAEWTWPFRIPSMLSGHSLRVGEGCVEFQGFFASGRFFFDLKRKNTANGPVFHVGHRVVAEFPDEVMLTVEVASWTSCSRGAQLGPVIPSLDPFKSLRAEAVYIRDLKKCPLEINLKEEGNDAPAWAGQIAKDCLWVLRYELKTKGVRLTDALLITLFSKEGKKVTDLSWHQ